MRGIIQTEFSECCNAWVTILPMDYILPPMLKEIFYFKCTKCRKACHLKKKFRRENNKTRHHSEATFPSKAKLKHKQKSK